jgi:uncharacterized membrane protein
MFDIDAGERYQLWKKKIESLSYNFSQELDALIEEMEDKNLKLSDIFSVQSGQHPYIIKAFLRKTISIETLVILEKLNKYVEVFDKEITDTVVWPDISRLIKKYKPFLSIDTEKFNGIFRQRIRNAE